MQSKQSKQHNSYNDVDNKKQKQLPQSDYYQQQQQQQQQKQQNKNHDNINKNINYHAQQQYLPTSNKFTQYLTHMNIIGSKIDFSQLNCQNNKDYLQNLKEFREKCRQQKQRLHKVLKKNNIQICNKKNKSFDSSNIQILKVSEYAGGQIVYIDVQLGPYKKTLKIYNNNNSQYYYHNHNNNNNNIKPPLQPKKQPPCFHLIPCHNQGSYGKTYIWSYLSSQPFIVKCIQTQKSFKYKHSPKYQDKQKKTTFKNILKEYFITFMAGVLQIGPKVMMPLGFDIIVNTNCVEFCMEKCVETVEWMVAINKGSCIQGNKDNISMNMNSIIQQYKRQQTNNSTVTNTASSPLLLSFISSFQSQLKSLLFSLHLLNFTHNDIKPQNIMYSNKLNKIIFIDYGLTQYLSKPIGYKIYTRFLGTPHYSSDQMKALILIDKLDFVDLYHNDLYGVEKSCQIIIDQYEKELKEMGNNNHHHYYYYHHLNNNNNKIRKQVKQDIKYNYINKITRIQHHKNTSKHVISSFSSFQPSPTIVSSILPNLFSIHLKYFLFHQKIQHLIQLSNQINFHTNYSLQIIIFKFIQNLQYSQNTKYFYQEFLSEKIKESQEFHRLKQIYLKNNWVKYYLYEGNNNNGKIENMGKNQISNGINNNLIDHSNHINDNNKNYNFYQNLVDQKQHLSSNFNPLYLSKKQKQRILLLQNQTITQQIYFQIYLIYVDFSKRHNQLHLNKSIKQVKK